MTKLSLIKKKCISLVMGTKTELLALLKALTSLKNTFCSILEQLCSAREFNFSS